MLAYALHGNGLPTERVLLLRYPPQYQTRAFRVFTVHQALRTVHFPVPQVYYLGWSYYTRFILLLMDYVEGRGELGQSHAFFARVGPHFAQTLAQLHQIKWDTLPDLAALPFGYAFHDLGIQVRRLRNPELLEILQWLRAHVDQIRELPHVVVHGDYVLPNVLGDYTEITAVLNWDHVMLADPRFDVGYASAALGAYGPTLSSQFLDYYQAATGEPIEDCVFWEVFGALRLLTQLMGRLAALQSSPYMNDHLDQVWPAWDGLLGFVRLRTGLELNYETGNT
jgi:aminoglycoside phosphotransferase (APT) family kinase protein